MEEIDAYSSTDKLIYKEREDIIYDIGYKTQEDRDLCDLIIDNVEATISDVIKSDKVASIPLIGSIWKDKANNEYIRNLELIKEKKNTLSRAEYVKWVSEFRKNIAMNANKEQHNKYKLSISKKKIKVVFK